MLNPFLNAVPMSAGRATPVEASDLPHGVDDFTVLLCRHAIAEPASSRLPQ